MGEWFRWGRVRVGVTEEALAPLVDPDVCRPVLRVFREPPLIVCVDAVFFAACDFAHGCRGLAYLL